MIVVWTRLIPRSPIISTRSRKLSLNRKYQLTQRMMTSRSKWRPLKSSSMLRHAGSTPLMARSPTNMSRFRYLHQSPSALCRDDDATTRRRRITARPSLKSASALVLTATTSPLLATTTAPQSSRFAKSSISLIMPCNRSAEPVGCSDRARCVRPHWAQQIELVTLAFRHQWRAKL